MSVLRMRATRRAALLAATTASLVMVAGPLLGSTAGAVGGRGSSAGRRPASRAPLLPGRITAIGDSLMIDYESFLEQDLPGVIVNAQVSRQFSAGIQVVRDLRAAHQLGDKVIIDLGTNGTVTATEFAEMLQVLSGASRVVFVTVHVDQPWQGEVNAELRAGVAANPKETRLADWATLAAHHPGWFYSDGTHLPLYGPGAKALAGLVAAAVKAP